MNLGNISFATRENSPIRGGVYKTKTEDRRPKTKNRRPESLFILQLLKLQRKKHARNALLDYKT